MKRLKFGFIVLFVLVLQLIWVNVQAGVLPLWGQRAIAQDANTSLDTQPFSQLTAGSEVLNGLLTLYRDRQQGKVLMEIRPDQLNQNFLSIITLDAGVGESGLHRGTPVNDFLFQFRRQRNQIQLVIPNVYFRTDPSDPQSRATQQAFSDTVIATLPIRSIHPERHSILVDFSDLLLKDDTNFPDLSARFTHILDQDYTLNSDVSYLETVKAFPLNLEVDAVYGFSRSSNADDTLFSLDALPDSRAFNLTVHYSFSQLPQQNGYHPRLADDRIGYFITAYQDFSSRSTDDLFVRYLNRWHLEPQDPDAALSAPKQPIVFWIENTVPAEYRDAIREGILLWNNAFEQAGFKDAIEVRQMPEQTDWDPADVRYNVVRWSTSYRPRALGFGPSRVNPLTGEILDADILLDAKAVRMTEDDLNVLVQNSQFANLSSADLPFCSQGLDQLYVDWLTATGDRATAAALRNPLIPAPTSPSALLQAQEQCFGMEASQQMAMGGLAIATLQNVLPSSDAMQTYLHQFLRLLTAHEVGHTLGLRHNFRGSTMLNPADLNNADVTQTQGMTGSVMDYLPVNLAPPGVEQGDYFPTTLGPYDKWAIEYGYKYVDATNARVEQRALEPIAQRVAEPGLAYATDEDAISGLDPDANYWDLSGDMLLYSQHQMDNDRAIWQRLEQRYPLPGESYSKLRDRFNTVFSHYLNNATNLTRYIGGQVFNRDRRGDPGGRLPFEQVAVEKQRQTLNILNDYVFSDNAFQFSPDLINQLAPSRWSHWGSYPEIFSLEYPIYDNFLFLQSLVLSDLLSSERLARLRDAELRTHTGETLTIPELFDSLQRGLWAEVLQRPEGALEISSLRRGLQRQYLEILISMTVRNTDALQNATSFTDFIVARRTMDAPEDARVIARYQLQQLREAIARTLRRQGNDLDVANRAHLEEARDRITKALDAQIQSG